MFLVSWCLCGYSILSAFDLQAFAQRPEPVAAAQIHADKGVELMQLGQLVQAEAELRQAVKLVPTNTNFLALLAGVLGMQRKLEESNRYFSKVLELEPHNTAIRRNLAANQLQMGKLREARSNLNLILNNHPQDLQAMVLLGMASERSKDYGGAVKWLEAASGLTRQQPESLCALARSYYNLRNRMKARETLRLLSEHSSGANAIFLGGKIAAEAGDVETAERFFLSIASTYPEPLDVKYALASLYYKARRYQESRQILLDLIKNGQMNGEIFSLLAWCDWKTGNPGRAIRAFEQAIEIAPSNEAHYLDFIRILREAGRLPDALEFAKKGILKLPNSPSLQELRGEIETRMGLHRDAILSFGQAVRLDPASPTAWIGLGLAQANDLKIEAAITTFDKAVQRFPRHALVYQEYGRMLLIPWVAEGNPGSEPRAVNLLEKAVSLGPSLAEPHYQLGNLALQKGNTEEAMKHLKQAAQLDPTSSKTHFALERLYRKLGQTEEVAREHELFEKLKAEEDKKENIQPTPGGKSE